MLRTFRGCGAILLNKPKKLVEIVGAMTKALNSRQVTVKIRTGWDGESCTVLCHFVLHCIVLYCIVLYCLVLSCSDFHYSLSRNGNGDFGGWRCLKISTHIDQSNYFCLYPSICIPLPFNQSIGEQSAIKLNSLPTLLALNFYIPLSFTLSIIFTLQIKILVPTN